MVRPMFAALPSPFANSTKEAFVGAISMQPTVDGIVLFGSTAGTLSAWSDLDILVVIGGAYLPVRSGVTFVESRLTDLVFARSDEIEEIARSDTAHQVTDDWRGRLKSWLRSGRIVFDRHERLAGAQRQLQASELDEVIPNEEIRRRWDHANYNVAQTARYAAAPDDLYARAFELRMTYQLADAMVDYFRVRSMAWRGEKEAFRFWEQHDPEFASTLFACLGERDRRRQFALYREVVSRVLEPVGGLWPDGSSSMTPRDGFSADEAAAFWARLADPSIESPQ